MVKVLRALMVRIEKPQISQVQPGPFREHFVDLGPCFIQPPQLGVSHCKLFMNSGVRRHGFPSLLQQFRRPLISAVHEQDETGQKVDTRGRSRIQSKCCLHRHHGLGSPTGMGEHEGKVYIGLGVVGIEGHGLLHGRDGFVVPTVHHLQHPEHGIRPRIVDVQRQRLSRRLVSPFTRHGAGQHPIHVEAPDIDRYPSVACVSIGKLRVEGHRLFVQRQSIREPLAVVAIGALFGA